AFVCGEYGIANRALGEAMKVTVESSHDVEVLKALQQLIRVRRPVGCARSQREMGEDNRWLFWIQPFQLIVHPTQRRRFNRRILILQPVTRIQRDELPAAMAKTIVELSREKLAPSGPIGL